MLPPSTAVLIIAGTLGIYHLIFALLNLHLLKPTFILMKTIAHHVGNVLSIIIFSLFFYLIFTPIALILRASGKDVISGNSKNAGWIPVQDSANDPKKLEKLY